MMEANSRKKAVIRHRIWITNSPIKKYAILMQFFSKKKKRKKDNGIGKIK